MSASPDLASLTQLLTRLESSCPTIASTSSNDAKWNERLRGAMLRQAELSLATIEQQRAAPEADIRRLKTTVSRVRARLPHEATRGGANDFSQVQVKIQDRPSASAIRRRQILTHGLYDDDDDGSSASSSDSESDSSSIASSSSSYTGGADELNPIRARAIAAGHTWTTDPLPSGTPSSSASADGHGAPFGTLSVPFTGPGLIPQRKPSITITDVDRAPNHSRLLEDDELHGQEEEDEYAAYEAAAAAEAKRRQSAAASSNHGDGEEDDFDEKSTIHGHSPSSIAGSSDETHTVGGGGGGETNPALQSDRALQDSLSSELLRMAQALKSNSLAFASALERDRKLLEESTGKLEVNLDIMTRTRGRLGLYSKKARSLGWTTLGAIVMVVVSWVVMFVIIRLT